MESQIGQRARCRGRDSQRAAKQGKITSLPLGRCPAGLRPRQYLRDQRAIHRGGGSPCPEIVLRGLSTKTIRGWRGGWLAAGVATGEMVNRHVSKRAMIYRVPRVPFVPFLAQDFFKLKPGPFLVKESASNPLSATDTSTLHRTGAPSAGW